MALIALLLLLFGLYLVTLAMYRLYLSPLATIPGPKLAALSKWYEAYYEIYLKGQFSFHIDKLHEQYGPVIRITPEEVHIKDSAFWDEVFVRRRNASKYSSIAARFGNNDSMFTAFDAGYHRMLRAPLNTFFSRRAILEQQKLVQDKAELLCQGFDRCRLNGTIFRVTDAFAAFAGDVISQYSFGFSYGQVEKVGWEDNFHDAYIAMSAFGHVSVQFPWLNQVVESLPESFMAKSDPSLAKMLLLKKDFRNTILSIRDDAKAAQTEKPDRTIFHAILQSDLPEEDKTDTRLGHEAQTVIGAGIVTTAWALTNAVFYILSNKDILTQLLSELREAIPDPTVADALNYEKLEKLPYLAGCVKEGVRHSYGISGRNPRIFQEPLEYKDAYTSVIIAPGTAVSMSFKDVTFDEDVFQDAKQFKPERWLPSAPKPADGTTLDDYFVTFGKGPRMCLGINLAHMELYVVLASVFRRFTLELYETNISDVELAHDMFLPSPKLDSKGVRVRVSGIAD